MPRVTIYDPRGLKVAEGEVPSGVSLLGASVRLVWNMLLFRMKEFAVSTWFLLISVLQPIIFATIALALVAIGASQDQGPTVRPFAVTMRRYAFDPPRLVLDLVWLVLAAGLMARAWLSDAHRGRHVAAPARVG